MRARCHRHDERGLRAHGDQVGEGFPAVKVQRAFNAASSARFSVEAECDVRRIERALNGQQAEIRRLTDKD